MNLLKPRALVVGLIVSVSALIFVGCVGDGGNGSTTVNSGSPGTSSSPNSEQYAYQADYQTNLSVLATFGEFSSHVLVGRLATGLAALGKPEFVSNAEQLKCTAKALHGALASAADYSYRTSTLQPGQDPIAIYQQAGLATGIAQGIHRYVRAAHEFLRLLSAESGSTCDPQADPGTLGGSYADAAAGLRQLSDALLELNESVSLQELVNTLRPPLTQAATHLNSAMHARAAEVQQLASYERDKRAAGLFEVAQLRILWELAVGLGHFSDNISTVDQLGAAVDAIASKLISPTLENLAVRVVLDQNRYAGNDIDAALVDLMAPRNEGEFTLDFETFSQYLTHDGEVRKKVNKLIDDLFKQMSCPSGLITGLLCLVTNLLNDLVTMLLR